MKQVKASVPDELLARLEAASAKSGSSLSAEIAARIESSFARDVLDKSSRRLLDFLTVLPYAVKRETNHDWHDHPRSYSTFQSMVLWGLAQFAPDDSRRAFGERPHQAVESDDPEEIAIWLAGTLWEAPNYMHSPLREMDEKRFGELAKHRQKGRKR